MAVIKSFGVIGGGKFAASSELAPNAATEVNGLLADLPEADGATPLAIALPRAVRLADDIGVTLGTEL